MYKIRVNGNTITVTGGKQIDVAESLNTEKCQFIFNSEWSGLTCYACFKNSNLIDESQILLDSSYTCTIPGDVLAKSGDLYVGALGVNAANGNIVKPTVWERLAIILEGVSPTGQILDCDNPSVIAQLTGVAEEALETANEALDKASQANENSIEALNTVEDQNAVIEKNIEDNEQFKEEIEGISEQLQNDYAEFLENYQRNWGVEQSVGSSTTNVMSQKAVTDELDITNTRLYNLNKNLYNIMTDVVFNGFLNAYGVFSSNNSYRTTDYIPIKSGESFDYKLSHGTTLPIICFYDSTKTFDSAITGIYGYSTGTYTASTDGYVRFTYYVSSPENYVVFTNVIPTNIENKINDAKKEVNLITDIEVDEVYHNVYNIKTNGITNGWVNSNGTISITGNYRHTDYLHVKNGDSFTYKLSHGVVDAPLIAFYSESKIYDSTKSVIYDGGTTYKSGTYTATADGYIIFTYLNTYDDVYVVFTSIIPTNIENAINSSVGNGVIQSNNYTDNLYKKIYAIKTDGLVKGYIDASGNVNPNGPYNHTEFLHINTGDIIKYNLSHSVDAVPIIAYYNESKVYDSTKSVLWTYGNIYQSGTYTATADGYIRITYLTSRDDVYAIFYEDIPDNIKQYVPPITQNLNVLMMGDSIFGNDGEIEQFLLKYTKSVVNGAFGGTRVTVRASGDWQWFDGVNIISALCDRVWTNQDTAAENLSTETPWITSRLADLKAVDMSNIDVLIMDWGTNDYTSSETIENITGAYDEIIDMLQEEYPLLRILICTPIWRYWGTKQENLNGDTRVFNVSTLKEIANAIESWAKNKRISVLNAYQEMPLSYNTASKYFDSNSGVHINSKGNEVYAHLIRGKLNTMF